MKLISSFIATDPPLKRLILSQNVFITDYGMLHLIDALSKNNSLQQLSIMHCTGISNISLESLYELVRDKNMTLFKVDLDESDNRFDTKLAMAVVAEAHLSKSIQKHLKPRERQVTMEMRTLDFETGADNEE